MQAQQRRSQIFWNNSIEAPNTDGITATEEPTSSVRQVNQNPMFERFLLMLQQIVKVGTNLATLSGLGNRLKINGNNNQGKQYGNNNDAKIIRDWNAVGHAGSCHNSVTEGYHNRIELTGFGNICNWVGQRWGQTIILAGHGLKWTEGTSKMILSNLNPFNFLFSPKNKV